MKVLLGALGVFVLCACTAHNISVDPAPDFHHEFQTRYVEPYVAGRTEDWLNVFADDAVALHDGLPPLEGKSAIREFSNSVVANFTIKRLDAQVDEVRQHGDWAWIRGQFVSDFEARSDEAPLGVAGERMGKFSLLWEKQESGEWRIIMDMGNSIQPPPDKP